MCGASSLSTKELERANDHVSRVLCPGDGESVKLTPQAHYNDYTAKERAEVGKYVVEGSRARVVTQYEICQNLKSHSG